MSRQFSNFARMNSEVAKKTKFVAEYMPYADTGCFSRVVLDFLIGDEKLKPFYGRRAVPESFAEQMEEKSAHYAHRDTLVRALKRQYADAGLKQPTIDTLGDSNAYTITTGHQVCLFGGPLYFFYKIITAVNTCRRLAETYPDKKFVPVFWMATEDHDFAEANHFYLPNGRVEWESGQGGAVGRMTTVGMDEVEADVRRLLGTGYRSEELISMFHKAYVEHETIADATRFLVHTIFGHLGVVAIDGDDAELKAAAAPMFHRELLEGLAAKSMRVTGKALDKHYPLQVHARDINLFYLGDGFRQRIVAEGDDQFSVVHTGLRFKRDELLAELDAHPERFSPNVALRPVYQEIILPNLAYIGGGGELAYWFQLKGVFEAFDVPYPVVMLRNSLAVTTVEAERLIAKLDLDVHTMVCTSGEQLEESLIKSNAAHTLDLKVELEELEALFGRIKSRAGRVDKLLERSTDSGLARAERIVHNLEKKMLRAERKKQEILTGRLAKLQGVMFPNGGLQERHYGMALPYMEYGREWLDGVIKHTDPFAGQFTVLRPAGES